MILELENSYLSVKVSTLGAELFSMKKPDGTELLWQGDPKYWSGRAPVLFPIVGALRNKSVLIDGKSYSMNQHGFAKEMEFKVESHSKEKVVLYIESCEKTRESYPFSFKFSVIFTLAEKELTTTFKVENKGQGSMPYAVGGHPAFNIPINKGEKFEDYEVEFCQNENQHCPQVDLAQCLIDYTSTSYTLENERIIPLVHQLFAVDALIFDQLNSDIVRLKNPKTQSGIEMNIKDFSMLGIWSASNNANFVALEPWTGCATTTEEGDKIEDKRHMRFLNKGETQLLSFGVKYF